MVETQSGLPSVHVCIATGQNAANLIPLLQYDAKEVWILQTPTMKTSAANLAMALREDGRTVLRKEFDDASPPRLQQSAEAIAEQLDGRHVVLHVSGGTKLMVLALRDGMKLVETGEGRLDIVYAETARQQIEWLGDDARTEPMLDSLDLNKMLLVQGYRIEGDNRHAQAQQRAQVRARMTRELGEKAGSYGRAFSPLATIASRAADSAAERELTQFFDYPPGGRFAELLAAAKAHGLLSWDGDVTVTFASREDARYFAGAWLEEFVLLKLAGGLSAPGHFSCNLRVVSADGVPNEIDAMVMSRNRALLIECKTGRQDDPADALYKLAQLRSRLGGAVAKALYLSAQDLHDSHLKRAKEYQIDVLCGHRLSGLVDWLRNWKSQ